MKINLRDLILGGQDGLVNTFSIILGLSAAVASERTIIVAALAAAFAEAISMGAVSYTSSKADKVRAGMEHNRELFGDAFIVSLAAFVGAVIPIVPFFFVVNPTAVIISVILAAIALFSLGASTGKTFSDSKVKSGMEILFIGFLAAFAGFIIGLILK